MITLAVVERLVSAFWSRNVFTAEVVRAERGKVVVRRPLGSGGGAEEGPYSVNGAIGPLRVGDSVAVQRFGPTYVVMCVIQTRGKTVVEA